MQFVELVKGFLTSPVETFQKVRETSFGETFKYFVILSLIPSVILGIVYTIAGTVITGIFGAPFLGMAVGILMIPLALVFIVIGAIIGGVIFQIFVYIVGGRKGIDQTLKAVMYGLTPALLFGWIPLIGIIAALWSLVLEIIGIRELHEITTGRAVTAMALMIVVLVIVNVVISAI